MQDDLRRVQKLACSGLLLPRCHYNFMYMKKFVDFLRATRLQSNYTQEYVADKLDVTTSTISRWENGETEITLQQAFRYAEVLELDLRKVFAFLANEDSLIPIGEIHVTAYSQAAYMAILQAALEQQLDVTIKTSRY